MRVTTASNRDSGRSFLRGFPAASRRVGEWLASEHGSHLPLDLGLVGALVAALVTEDVVMWFHVIFLLLVVAALMLPFRQFVIRLVVWMSVTVALVTWATTSLDTPSEEVTELPLLTLVLILVYLVAQARASAARDAEQARAEIERRAYVERELLHRQLEDAQRRELIGRTSLGLAHDLRNVFVVIKGCVDEDAGHVGRLPADVPVDAVCCLGELEAAADRGLAIIDDLLWLNQHHDFEMHVTDVGESIRQIEPFLRRMVHRGITLRVISPTQPSFAHIDHVGLAQVLMNLVSNAADAIDGVGNITVSAQRSVSGPSSADSGHTTSITVTDDGCGFTKEALEHAFEPDFTTKTGTHGGYGLATVWRIIDRCGGSVQIDSSPDSGTTVVLRLQSASTARDQPVVESEAPSATDFAADVVSEVIG